MTGIGPDTIASARGDILARMVQFSTREDARRMARTLRCDGIRAAVIRPAGVCYWYLKITQREQIERQAAIRATFGDKVGA